jgi:hypothetical protein
MAAPERAATTNVPREWGLAASDLRVVTMTP